ncbi:Uncharacterised protein [Paenibacillus thiaminolyticus]|nr:Uncharacterised protein [Paenibacillus thiaminolyticus]
MHEMRRNHILRQSDAQEMSQFGRLQALAAYVISAQTLASRPLCPSHDSRLANIRVKQQPRFDFAEFNPVTPYFDLLIDSAPIFERSVRQPAGQIPCSVHASAFNPWIRNEFFLCKLRQIPISRSDASPAKAQFPRHADRKQLPPSAQHIGCRPFDRPADRNVVFVMGLLDRECSREGRVLGRPVSVPDRKSRTCLLHGVSMLRRENLPAHNQMLYAGKQARFLIGQLMEQRGRQEHDRNPVLCHKRPHPARVQQHVLLNRMQGASMQQGSEYFECSRIKAYRTGLREAVIGMEPHVSSVVHQVDYISMRHQHSFRSSRCARGIQDISRIIATAAIRFSTFQCL